MARAGRKALSVSHEPFNLSYTADEEAASSHKEHPQRFYDSILYPKAAIRPPWITNWAFFFKGKKGKDRGSAQNGIQCVGEGGSGHQSKAVPAGVHPEVRCPPWVSCSPGPGRRLGSISWTDLVSIRLPVFGLPEGYTLPLTEDIGLERPEVNCFGGKIIYV